MSSERYGNYKPSNPSDDDDDLYYIRAPIDNPSIGRGVRFRSTLDPDTGRWIVESHPTLPDLNFPRWEYVKPKRPLRYKPSLLTHRPT